MTDPRTESARAAAAHGTAHGHGVRSEEDRIPSIPIVAVGVGALVIFALASWVTLSFLHGREVEQPLPPTPQEIGQSKIGMVEQQLFERATRGTRDLEERRERLRSYGWVDRKSGIVRIPIDRAMELSAKGVRPKPTGPGTSTAEAQP